MQADSPVQLTEHRNTLGHLLLVTGAFLSLCFLALTVSGLKLHAEYFEKRTDNLVAVLLSVGYLSIIVGSGIPATNRKTGSFAGGFSIAITVLLFFSLPLLFIGAIWSGYSIVPEIAWFISNLVLLIGTVMSMRTGGGRAILVVAGLATVPCIFVAATVFAHYEVNKFQAITPNSVNGPTLIYRVEKCLIAYRMKAGHGSYPADLRQLQSALPGCAERSLTDGKYVEGYKLVYQLVPASGGKRFSLLALPALTVGKYETSFFSNETGLIYTQTERRVADTRDPLVPTTDLVQAALECVRNFSVRLEWSRTKPQKSDRDFNATELRYPESFSDIADLCFSNPGPSSMQAQISHETNSLSDATYTVTYHPPTANGSDFALLARPLHYGETGIRSYFVDASGVFRTTLEDREATREDASFQHHEVSGDCCPYENEFLPVSQFKIESDPDGNQLPGGLADGKRPRMLWHTRGYAPRLLRADPAGDRLFVSGEHMSIGVFTTDLKPLWAFYGGSGYTRVVDDWVYTVSGSVLTKFTSAGEQTWSFIGITGPPAVAADATVFGQGRYLYSLRPDGRELWRMQLKGDDRPSHAMALSSDGKVLYIARSDVLYAVDAHAGLILWKFPYRTGGASELDDFMLLEDHSVLLTIDLKDGAKELIAVRDGKRLWARQFQRRLLRIEVIHGTDTVLVETNGAHPTEALGPDGKTMWEMPLKYANSSNTKGLFYACLDQQLKLFDSQGHVVVPIVNGPMCGDITEGPDNLVIINDRTSTWTVKLAKSPTELAEDALKTRKSASARR